MKKQNSILFYFRKEKRFEGIKQRAISCENFPFLIEKKFQLFSFSEIQNETLKL